MKNKNILLTGLAASALTLVGCGSDSNSSNPFNDTSVRTTLDTGTTNESKWAYFDLDEGKEVTESEEWEIAVKRMEVMVNDHVESALALDKPDFYVNDKPVEQAFVKPNLFAELDNFYSTVSVDEMAYQSTGHETVIQQRDWYNYDSDTHVLSAKSENFWVVQSAEGDGTFAKVNVSDISGGVATFDFYLEQVGDGAFSQTAVSVPVDLGEIKESCFDFQSAQTVLCSDAGWDIKFDIAGYVYKVRTNGGVSGEGVGKALGPVAIDTYTTGTEQGLTYGLKEDYLGSAFADASPWAYGADSANPHAVLPNYRVYALKYNDMEPVKVQFIDYYNEMGESGKITMRYMSLEDDGQDTVVEGNEGGEGNVSMPADMPN